MKLIRDWNEFWFALKSPGPLGLFRLALGAIFLFWGILMAPPSLYTWYTETGPVPLSFYTLFYTQFTGSVTQLNLFANVSNPHIIFAAWLLYLLAAACFMAGFCTRTSNIVLFVLFLSFNYRDPLILNNGDTMLRCLLFIMLFSPAGKSCSVDRMIAIARGKDPGGPPPLVELWTQRLLQIQVALSYAASVCSQLSGKDWIGGIALYYPLHTADLHRFHVPAWTSSGNSINLLTWGMIAVEAGMATLIWNRRARPYVLFAGIALNAGIDYAFNLPLLSWIMAASYLNFVYNGWLARVAAAFSRCFRACRLSVYLLDGNIGSRWQKVVERLDFLNLLNFVPTSDKSAACLTVRGSKWEASGLSAMQRIIVRLPACWILLPIVFLSPRINILNSFLPPTISENTYEKSVLQSH
jgi:hypothetical protein